jgi:hypothetical protein
MWRPVVLRMSLNVSDTALTFETWVFKYAMALQLSRQTRFFCSIPFYASIIEELYECVIQLCTLWHEPIRPKHIAVCLLKRYCNFNESCALVGHIVTNEF